MAWSGTYTQKILDTLNTLGDSQYNSEYKDKINGTASQIENYGDYNSKYQDQINNTTNQIANYGNYNSAYKDKINSLLDQTSNWNYDPESDAEYQAYKNQYTNLGNTAMKDTLGQVSARTGGLASSYAGSAAQQAYNGYMQQLANIIPTLSQNAYNRALNSLSAYQSQDNTDYGRWQDQLNSLYNKNNMYLNLDNADYDKWQNALNNLYNQNSMYSNMDANAYSQYNGNVNNLYSLLSALYTQDDRERADYEAELAALTGGSGGYSYGGSGGSGSGSNGNTTLLQEVQNAYAGNYGNTTAKTIQQYINSQSNAGTAAQKEASTWLKTQEAKAGNTTSKTEQNTKRKVTGAQQ